MLVELTEVRDGKNSHFACFRFEIIITILLILLISFYRLEVRVDLSEMGS